MRRTRRFAMAATAAAIGLCATAGSASAGIWTQIDSGLGAGATDIIRSVDYQSADRLWYVTSSGKFGYREGGVMKLGTPGTSTAGVSFNEVAFQPGGNVGIAVGSAGNVWRSTDGGKNWSKITITTYEQCGSDEQISPPSSYPTISNPGALRAVAWGAGNRVYVGGDQDTLLRSNDGGASFTEINKTPAEYPGFPTYSRIDCKMDPGTGVGEINPLSVDASTPDSGRPIYFLNPDGHIWFTSDGLASSAEKRSPIGYGSRDRYALAIDPVNTNRQWAMSSDANNGVWDTTDGGASYDTSLAIKNASPGESLESPQDLDGAGQLTLVAVGKGGDIVNSVDGDNWYFNKADGALATKDWYSVSGFDATHFAAGGNGGTLILTEQANTIPDITPPTGTIGGPTSVVAGQAATFTAQLADNAGGSGIDPNNIVWTVAGFPEQRGATATYTFPAASFHNLKVSFRDLAGNTAEDTHGVSVTTPVVVTPTPLLFPSALPPASKPPVTGGAVRRVKGKYVMKVKGTFKLPPGYTQAQACNGTIILTVKRGKTLITARTTKLNSKCGYAKTIQIARSKIKNAKKLTLTVRFGGNAFLAATARNYKVKVKK